MDDVLKMLTVSGGFFGKYKGLMRDVVIPYQ